MSIIMNKMKACSAVVHNVSDDAVNSSWHAELNSQMSSQSCKVESDEASGSSPLEMVAVYIKDEPEDGKEDIAVKEEPIDSNVNRTRRYLTKEEIASLLEEIESDFSSNTDIESDHEPTKNSAVFSHDQAASSDDDEQFVIQITSEENATDSCISTSQDEPNLSRNVRRKWRKKAEKASNIEFIDYKENYKDILSPLDSFLLFFDDDLLNKINYETNLKCSQAGKAADISVDEIKTFLGINIVMGYNRCPTINSYWMTGDDIGVQCIKEAMSRDRFYKILHHLHLNDNSKMNRSKADKLYKVRPLLKILKQKFEVMRGPQEHLSVGKLIIKFKGRSSLKQYNPLKPIKRGYKVWCLADDEGYVYDFDIYAGKSTSQIPCRGASLGLEADVVLKLTEKLHGKNHKVFLGNFFSSIPLLETMKANKIQACGTIRTNRKDFPHLESDKKLTRGKYDYRSTTDGITVFKWMDSKAVHLISNFHGTENSTVSHKLKNGQKIIVKCPLAIKDYNEHMGGVERHDQLRQLYGIKRKNIKWWHCIFFGLLDMAIVNSFILYRDAGHPTIDLLDYRRELGTGLLTFSTKPKTSCKRRRKSDFSTPASVRLSNVGVHWPQFNVSRGRCQVCSKKGEEARPAVECEHCKVHLCCNSARNCFKEFHQ
ncbi:piggyBac transposable element-derived protein 4-like isoform X2 [Hyalella azteca]|uniref:PiggyBac transposable element-derived protein 4-like isoform X2 n=1 Tax=Hyalella azteca TaxID=294128 RepID=A0A8B7NIF5_HYAAZ|nr:piggyBac transposable element-derived protein 4-like isoform X2 [Hyalella azteca]